MSARFTQMEPDNASPVALATQNVVRQKALSETAPTSTPLTPGENKMTVVVARTADELKPHLDAWKKLAATVIEPNAFYESWMLVPAIEVLGKETDLYVVLIYATDPLHPFGEKILCGLFPLERLRNYKIFPLATFRFWKSLHGFLCTPLIHTEFAHRCLATFFDWLKSPAAPAKLMEFYSVAGDGLFYRLLIDELNNRGCLTFSSESYNRAMFKPHTSEPSVVEGISGRHKKELRRKLNRLAEEGTVEFVALEFEDEVDAWIQEFLTLEAMGWKGQEGTAFAADVEQKKFFEKVVKNAFANGRLMMLALRLSGKAIAMKCNFLSGRGSFAFKIAFDEHYSRFSPGVLLEMENMRRLEAMPEREWMDSCAVAEHFMINRLWTSRRNITTLLVSTGKGSADLLVSTLPLLRWLSRKLKGIKKRS